MPGRQRGGAAGPRAVGAYRQGAASSEVLVCRGARGDAFLRRLDRVERHEDVAGAHVRVRGELLHQRHASRQVTEPYLGCLNGQFMSRRGGGVYSSAAYLPNFSAIFPEFLQILCIPSHHSLKYSDFFETSNIAICH